MKRDVREYFIVLIRKFKGHNVSVDDGDIFFLLSIVSQFGDHPFVVFDGNNFFDIASDDRCYDAASSSYIVDGVVFVQV